jgi:hypothetical protein
MTMSQSYTKGCRDCGQQIRMDQVNGKWAAYELDGSGFHTCKQQQQKREQQPQKLTLEMVDIRLKRVENMLFNQTK